MSHNDEVCDLMAENGRLQESIRRIRNEIIEKCAKACEARIVGTDGLEGGNLHGHYASYNCEDLACAHAVRRLKDMP